MKVLYFARVRQTIGKAEETVSPPDDVQTVRDLMRWLMAKGEPYGSAFAEENRIRAAVNQEFAGMGDRVGAQDEVAFFPPVTGG